MMIAALDIATQCGVAIGKSNDVPHSYSYDLGRRQSEGHRFSQALALTHKIIIQHKPDLIAVEAAIGGPKASAYLIGLVACVRGCAANQGVRCEAVNLGAIRKHFLGKHLTSKHYPELSPRDAKKAIKQQVMDRCALIGWQVTDDNAADACALWDFAHAHFGGSQSIPGGGLFK